MSEPTNVVVLRSEYWIRISVVVKVCLKEALLDILHDPTIGGLTRNKQQLHYELINFKAREEKKLKGIIKDHQWDKLCHSCSGNCPIPCPRLGQTDSQDMDVTCIIVLIIQLTNLPPPFGNKAWRQTLPQIGDATTAAIVLLARQLRNDLIHCSLQQLCTQQQFDDFWKRIENVLLGLGYKKMVLFNEMKTSSLDPYHQQQFDSLCENLTLQKCDIAEEVENLKQTLINETIALRQKIENENAALREKVDEVEKRIDIPGTKSDSQRLSFNLKKETKKRFDKVKVAFAPKSSLCCDDFVDRDDIIVDLSLITDTNTVFNMAQQTSDIKQISEIRQKQKKIASNKINYKDIVTSSDDYIVISGVPGCGKTTLIETLLDKWGSNQLWNDPQIKFDFVFVIYFRKLARFNSRLHVTAEEILSFFYPEFEFQFKETKSLLILDGFDEFARKEDFRLKEEEFTSYVRAVYDLLDPNNSRLPFTRLVTSRPGSCPTLFKTVLSQHCSQKVFEVRGFSDENIVCYIRKHFPEDNQAQKVLEKLKRTPIVYDMMIIPFYCWGICYLVKNDIPVEEFAQTYTALYINLLTLFIRNHGLRNESIKLNNTLDHPKFKKTCIGLAKLAFNLEQNGQITFTQRDLFEEIEMKDLMCKSGMIVEIESNDITSPFPTYQFLHCTFHEFLVALHMFVTGKPIVYSKNIQILSMLAGLLGGSLNPSGSSHMVQRFSKQFSIRNDTSVDEIIELPGFHISVINLYSIIFEFHNPVITNCNILVRNESLISPYLKQCEKFVDNLLTRKQLRFGKLTLICIFSNMVSQVLLRTRLPLPPSPLRLAYHCKELFIDDHCDHAQLTKENNLHFERIILYSVYPYKEWGSSLQFAQHTQVLEIVGGKEHLNILRAIKFIVNQQQYLTGSRKMKKLVIHHKNIIDVEEILKHADVCEEVVFAYNNELPSPYAFRHEHTHGKNCVKPPAWKQVMADQKSLKELLPTRHFKKLKNISIGASCAENPFSTPTVIFSPVEPRI